MQAVQGMCARLCLLEKPWCKVPPILPSSLIFFFFLLSFLSDLLISLVVEELAANQLRILEF